MMWDPVLKKNLLKYVLTSPVSSARDPQKTPNTKTFISMQSKCRLIT